MSLTATAIILIVLELCGLALAVIGEGAADAGTYMFWSIALASTVVVVTIFFLLL